MNPEFKHFVITFFNLRLWDKDKTQQTTRTDAWLEERFNLFERYCFPGFERQTNKNFIWLCMFDVDTPETYKKKIDRFVKRLPQFRPCFYGEEAREFFAEDEARRVRFLRCTVRSMLIKEDKYVITTNVDNDDAIHCRMVETIQSHFLQHPVNERILYSLNWGLQYFVNQQLLLKMCYPHNHFLTLIEPAHIDFHTVEFYGHAGARKRLPTVDILEQPYWIEVVHGHNVNNGLRITSRIRYGFFLKACSLKEFGLPVAFTARQNCYNALVRYPVYFIPTALRKLYRKMFYKR